MLAYELIERLKLIKELTDANNELLKVISGFSRCFDSVYNHNRTTISYDYAQTNNTTSLIKGLNTLLREGIIKDLRSDSKTYDIETVINLTNDYRKKLQEYKTLPTQSIIFNEIETGINLFLGLYKSINQSGDVFQSYDLLKVCYDLTVRIEYLAKFIDELFPVIIGHFAEPGQLEQENWEAIDIGFDSENTVTVLRAKLGLINEIYNNLFDCLDAKASDYPLKVIRVEQGSLWVKLVGYVKAIALIKPVMGPFLGFIYRNYTLEGKGYAALEFRKAMSDLGIDTKRTDQSLDILGAKIAKNVIALHSQENKIIINRQSYNLPQISENDQSLLIQTEPTKSLPATPKLITEAEVIEKPLAQVEDNQPKEKLDNKQTPKVDQ